METTDYGTDRKIRKTFTIVCEAASLLMMAATIQTKQQQSHHNIGDDVDNDDDDDDDDLVRLKPPCPCDEFGTIESIAKVLLLAGEAEEKADAVVDQKKRPNDADADNSPQNHKQQQQQQQYAERHARLLEWLSSSSSSSSLTKQVQQHGNDAPCPHRVNASLSILNGIRDACQPFLNHPSSSTVVTTSTPLVESTSFTMNENAFPSLSSTSTLPAASTVRKAAAESRPGVWGAPNKKQQQQQQQQSQQHTAAPQSITLKKPKRRIRPASTSLQVGSAVPVSGPWGRSNSSSPSYGVGTTSSSISTISNDTTNITLVQHQQQQGGKVRRDILETRMHNPNTERHSKPQQPTIMAHAVGATMINDTTRTSCNEPSKGMGSTIVITPDVMLPGTRSDSNNTIAILRPAPLNRLVQVYCILIEHYLVPSTALELHLLLRLLAIPVTPATSAATINHKTNDNVVFRSVISSTTACIYFAKHALERLSDILRGLGLMQYLVTCPPFQQHCPDVTREFKALLLQQEQQQHNKAVTTSSAGPSTILWKLQSVDNSVSSAPPRTALLTQSFNPARDSRHNYRSRPHQILYNNREECRDSFLFQLRSFLHVRGGGGNSNSTTADNEAHVLQQIQTSSRMIIDKLLDANLAWFAEFFCDLLLQIGSIPHQETDKELLKIAGDDQDKLAKLHKRLSSKAAPTNKSSKRVAANAKRGGGGTTTRIVGNGNRSSTADITTVLSSAAMILDAQQAYFSGHQEFFFLFMVLADSYKFGLHLRSHLIAKMTELISNLSTDDILESKLLDMQLVARFIGVLFFSWSSSSSSLSSSNETPSVSVVVGTDDGVHQLAAAGLSMIDRVKRAWQSQNLVAVIPWVVEILKMSAWDKDAGQSSGYRELLSLLRSIQTITTTRTKPSFKSGQDGTSIAVSSSLAGRELVASCLESLFDDVVGLARAATLPLLESSSVFIESRNRDYGTCTLEDTERDDAVGLDRSITSFSSAALFACAPHVEDVVALISTITSQHASFSMTSRTHGATRKLRPNVVVSAEALQGTPSNGFGLPHQNASDRPASATTLLQTKLKDTFFHRHQALKEICEFTVSRVLCNMISALPGKCIDAILNGQSSSDGDDDCEELIAEEARTAGRDFLKTTLKENVYQSLDRLAPGETTPQVVEIACTLAVDQGMKRGAAIVDSVVADRIRMAHNAKAKNEKKRLLASGTAATGSEVELDRLTLVIHHLEQVEKELSTSPALEWDKVLDAVVSLRLSLDSWISTMGNRFPPEQSLRSLFEAVLRLDEHSYTLLHAVFSTADPAPSNDTCWSVLAEYLRVATRIRKFSRHGLATVGHFLANMDSLSIVISLGLTAATATTTANNDASGLAPLVVDLMVSRLVSTTQLELVCESMATRASTASTKTTFINQNQQSFDNLFIEIVACSKKEPSLPLARLECLLSTHVQASY